MFKPVFILCIIISVISCTKSDRNNTVPTPPLTLLQNKWLIDSVYIYPASGMSSAYIYADKSTDTQYIDFKADGKTYSYGGTPVVAYDTSTYRLLADNSTFLVNIIENGVTSTKSDTGYILKLTASSLVYYTRDAARQYGKAVLKR